MSSYLKQVEALVAEGLHAGVELGALPAGEVGLVVGHLTHAGPALLCGGSKGPKKSETVIAMCLSSLFTSPI